MGSNNYFLMMLINLGGVLWEHMYCLLLLNFIFLIILYTNLNPNVMKGIVQNMFTIYWITVVCSLALGMFFALGVKNGEIEIALRLLINIIKLVSMIVISVKLYPNLEKINKVARVSYLVMTTTLSISLVSFIVMFIRNV